MTENSFLPDAPDDSRIAANIMHFARALRAAGLPIGTGRIIEAIRAVDLIDIGRRNDLYWTLHAHFVSRAGERALFDQAFHIFWRNPKLLERMTALLLPAFEKPEDEEQKSAISRRIAEAFGGDTRGEPEIEPELVVDAAMTSSAREVLREIDFEDMSAEEIAEAKQAIAKMRLPIRDIPTRRLRPSDRGRKIDLRASLREAHKLGHSYIPLQFAAPKTRPPAIVVLCDISGSMQRYSRMFLHFMHALSSDRDRVYSFVFGTRLTNISRYLQARDVDEALDRVSGAVSDWSGGTRIGACLHIFNRDWARRVLAQGAVVLLVSDGLDRDAAKGLEREIERLRKSCRRLIWLNPLLRYAGFEPKSLGIRAILPHVDEFRPVHNLRSLAELTGALSRPPAQWPVKETRAA